MNLSIEKSRSIEPLPEVLTRACSIPLSALEDCVTYLYETTTGDWPLEPNSELLTDMHWLKDGDSLELVNVSPGENMGHSRQMEVLEVLPLISIANGSSKGIPFYKFGQFRRLVLVKEKA